MQGEIGKYIIGQIDETVGLDILGRDPQVIF
jgi:hypothetical protein